MTAIPSLSKFTAHLAQAAQSTVSPITKVAKISRVSRAFQVAITGGTLSIATLAFVYYRKSNDIKIFPTEKPEDTPPPKTFKCKFTGIDELAQILQPKANLAALSKLSEIDENTLPSHLKELLNERAASQEEQKKGTPTRRKSAQSVTNMISKSLTLKVRAAQNIKNQEMDEAAREKEVESLKAISWKILLITPESLESFDGFYEETGLATGSLTFQNEFKLLFEKNLTESIENMSQDDDLSTEIDKQIAYLEKNLSLKTEIDDAKCFVGMAIEILEGFEEES